MQKTIKSLLFSLLIILSFFINTSVTSAQETGKEISDLPEINFFYSDTCPHCADQIEFHEELLEKYPNLIINSYRTRDRETGPILRDFAERYDAQQYTSIVPLTFIGESYIVGFKSAETTGKDIELALVKNSPGLLAEAEFCDDEESVLCESDLDEFLSATGSNSAIDSGSYTRLKQSSNLSAFGIEPEKLPLPILAIVLGFFDGFNVCSLGALMLILSLVLTFKSRKKVLLFGGLFILITGITYTALIFLWFSLFHLLTPYVIALELIIGGIGLIGGALFLRQYFRYKKYGPTCEMSDSKLINNAVRKLQDVFKNQRNIWVTGLAVIAFSFIVTVIEFPCSAVIPVAFAAILTDFGVGIAGKAFYLLLFMIFYLLDEIIIFLISLFTLKLWMGGNKMTTKLVLIQALVFILIGLFYVGRLIL
ncbi:MAG: hypothetical protein ACOCUH_03480 [Bacteriovoracia bacterium]